MILNNFEIPQVAKIIFNLLVERFVENTSEKSQNVIYFYYFSF